MILFLDSISRETVDPVKILLMASASTTLIIYSLPTDAIIPFPLQNGDFGWDWSGNFKFGVLFILVIVGVLFFYTVLKICLHSPPKFRIHSIVLLIGAFLLGILPLIYVATNLNLVYLGIEGIIMGVGAIICAIVIWRHPQIIFILPFEAVSLTVISTRSGIPLYSHSWKESSMTVNDTLFSGMIQGISGILNEAVHKGNIREIRMDEGLLTINHNKESEVAFVLISTKTSKVLRNGLALFAQKFVLEFRNALKTPEMLDAFTRASEWIPEIFSFIPESKNPVLPQ